MSNSQLKSLLPSDTKISLQSPGASSSKKAILKPDNETPWTAQTLPSSIHLVFPTPIADASHIALTFQGGFVGTSAVVYIATKPRGSETDVDLGLSMGGKIYPEDKNKRQVFEIPYPPNSEVPSEETQTAIDARPVQVSSPRSEPMTITMEVPPNPHGGGEKAEPLVPATDGTHASGEKAWLHPLIKEIKIEFEASSDQFGRITLYQVEILG